MTILEIETRSGLERSNIRFYEREGLLEPQRHANGYRDYSEEDLALLLRIKLLRRLGLSLEAIRALQSGDAVLEEALSLRLAGIDREQQSLEAAQAVCREICMDGASFASLDAPRYLLSYERASRLAQPLRPAVPESDRVPPPRCPWRRFFARGFDLLLLRMLFLSTLALVFRVNISDSNELINWLVGLVCWGMLIFLEAFLLSRFGATPGKWLLGLRLEHAEGRLLRFAEARERACRVFVRGEGYTIPIYNYYRNWKAYKDVMDGNGPEWDADVTFTAKTLAWWRPVSFVALYALVVCLGVLAALAPGMPQHRGNALTMEAFVENYNQLAAFYDMDRAVLQEDGSFNAPPSLPGVTIVNGYRITLGESEPLLLRFTVDRNGILKEVSFARKIYTPFYGLYFDNESARAMELCTMAFALADGSIFDLPACTRMLDRFTEHEEGTLEEDFLGCHLRHDVTRLGETLDESGSAPVEIYQTAFSISRLG